MEIFLTIRKMKKIAILAFILAILSPSVFAQGDYIESEDVVPVEISGEFVGEELQITWDTPGETDLDFYDIYFSAEDTTLTDMDQTLLLFSSLVDTPDTIGEKLGIIHQDPVDGVGFYRTCVFTILSTKKCSDFMYTYGRNKLILDPIVDSFPDIDGHWGYHYIEKLRALNVVEGRDGYFEPNSNIFRAEAIKIFMLAFELGGSSCYSALYPDMEHTDWFCDVVTRATNEGYVEGDQGMLYPGREITRAEAVKVVLEIRGDEVPEITEKPFDDVELDQWYAKYVAKAKELNIVEGMGNNLFEPNRSITRAELSKVAVESAEL